MDETKRQQKDIADDSWNHVSIFQVHMLQWFLQ